jgi:signal transduction histidine kinase
MSLILLAMPVFPPKIGYRWVGLFMVLIVGSMIVFGIVDPGLDVGWLVLNALLYVVIYFFLSTFMVVIGQLEVARDQAQEARVHSESLLAELQVAHEQLQTYTEQAEELAVTAERNRLARELHDSVTQSLHSAALMAEAGQRLAGTGDLERTRHYLSRLGDISQQALKEMRLMVYELRPLALRQVGLVSALQQRLDAVERRAGVDARLVVVGVAQGQEVELPAEAEEALYRIAQEALNNALKHGQPSTVTVTLRMEDRVELAVADDGAGFDANAALGSAGIGLSSMRERAEKLGGTLTIHSTLGEGTKIRIILP